MNCNACASDKRRCMLPRLERDSQAAMTPVSCECASNPLRFTAPQSLATARAAWTKDGICAIMWALLGVVPISALPLAMDIELSKGDTPTGFASAPMRFFSNVCRHTSWRSAARTMPF